MENLKVLGGVIAATLIFFGTMLVVGLTAHILVKVLAWLFVGP